MKPKDTISQAPSKDTARPLQTVTENLADVRARMCHMLACDYIHAESLAKLYARAHVHSDTQASASTALAALTDPKSLNALHERFVAESMPLKDIALPRHASLLDGIYRQMTTAEQLCFFRTLIEDAAVDPTALVGQLIGHSDEPIEDMAYGKIVYQHSIYTDEAFLHFSRVLPSAKACYADSFTGVCEQVFDGQCEYCILPLENTQDGKLVRFYGLIEKYELNIALTCKVTTSDNRHSTVFGLCRRGMTWPGFVLHDRNLCFEFIFWQEPEHLTLSKLLAAAESSSLSLLRADCLPRSDDEILMGAGYPFDLCFELSPRKTASPMPPERDFLAFLMFLSTHAPTYLPLGIYQNI